MLAVPRAARRAVVVLAALLALLALSGAPASAAAPAASAASLVLAQAQDPDEAADEADRAADEAAEEADRVADEDADASVDAPGDSQVKIDIDGGGDEPSKAISLILLLSVLSVAPALLLLCTSFTRIVIVLSLTRNALGVQAIPPNQVIVGLALFLSLFIMGPTLSEMNSEGLQPYLSGDKKFQAAFDDGIVPLREFMLAEVKEKELAMFVKEVDGERPARPEDVSMQALVPAFVLSEIKTAFIIGFVIFIPFLVIDIVVSSSLMAMGMMMLPPVLISLPFKLLLFVMVDGWALVVRSLLQSYG